MRCLKRFILRFGCNVVEAGHGLSRCKHRIWYQTAKGMPGALDAVRKCEHNCCSSLAPCKEQRPLSYASAKVRCNRWLVAECEVPKLCPVTLDDLTESSLELCREVWVCEARPARWA